MIAPVRLLIRPLQWLIALLAPVVLAALAFLVRNPIARLSVAALLLSSVLETAFAFNSAFAVPRDYDYGGPLPVGHCHHDFILSPASLCSTSWLLFAVDILVTAIVLFLLMRAWGGWGGLGPLGGLAAIPLTPRAPDGTVQLQLAWIVMVLAAVAVSGLARTGVRGIALRRQATRTPS